MWTAALAILLAFSLSACKSKKIEVRETVEEAPRMPSSVHVADPKAGPQLVSGFHELESNAWRWTARQFTVALGPPVGAAQRGAVLKLDLTVPQPTIDRLKTISLAASIGGTDLAPETYTRPGNYTYQRDVPRACLGVMRFASISRLINRSSRAVRTFANLALSSLARRSKRNEAARRAAYWCAAPLVCLLVYWRSFQAWFRGDDFAWLGVGQNVHSFHDLLLALFTPFAQGTIRPLSERLFFMAGFDLFGLDSLPYRLIIFATQFVNLALVASIGSRLTGTPRRAVSAPRFYGRFTARRSSRSAGSASTTRSCARFSCCWRSISCCASSRPARAVTKSPCGSRSCWGSALRS